ncbi:MAG: RNase adapter RapZ [Gammaproteobacteria bacterium]|nr:RNase adapter RapZ [Gammaproteobacteria bacterium]
MRLIIVSGLSGSGKSVALHMLEDLDFYCIDNIPAALLTSVISEIIATRDHTYDLTAVGVDARNRPTDIDAVPQLVEKLRTDGVQCEVLFLHADDNILLKRYSETRRKHPLSGRRLSLREAIARERQVLAPIRETADLIIDTTRTSVHDLRDAVRSRIEQRAEGKLSLLFESFGYKHGIPSDADFVFDVRCLPNPYWDLALRPWSGKDAPVTDYLEQQLDVRAMLADITAFLDAWIPAFKRSNRSYLTVALGCTGGQHRSVYIVERLAAHFSASYDHVLTRHTELTARSGDIVGVQPGE